jgi:hypothetical protein
MTGMGELRLICYDIATYYEADSDLLRTYRALAGWNEHLLDLVERRQCLAMGGSFR